MDRLSTIGYERASLDDFIETLKRANVNTLVDVRELPISRRKGFAKNALREALEKHGIDYFHERMLGSPKWIRDELRSNRDYAQFFNRYRGHLSEQEHVLQRLVDQLSGHVALMCYERNPCECHRKSVASRLQEITGLRPFHLGVNVDEQQSRSETLLDPGEGIPAA